MSIITDATRSEEHFDQGGKQIKKQEALKMEQEQTQPTTETKNISDGVNYQNGEPKAEAQPEERPTEQPPKVADGAGYGATPTPAPAPEEQRQPATTAPRNDVSQTGVVTIQEVRAKAMGWPIVALEVQEFGSTRAETLQILRDTFTNIDPLEGTSLERISMPGSGGTSFKRDTAAGQKSADTLTGVLVINQTARVYFREGEPPGSAPPLCSSRDAVYGVGEPGNGLREKGEGCVSCPLSQRGSSQKGAGSACKEIRITGLIEHHRPLAATLKLPPTALGAFNKFALALFNDGFQLTDVLTEVSLTTRNVSGYKVATPVFRVVGVLDAPSREYAKEYARILKESAGTMSKTLLAEGRKRLTPEAYDNAAEVANAHGSAYGEL